MTRLITYISMCSGIEAASVAVEPLGWQALAFSEVAPFPSAVLAHRYPAVPNLGDMMAVDWSRFRGRADVVVAGTPCQDFSIAGLRQGLDGARGQLTLGFLIAVDAIAPGVVVWENVPGVLSDDTNAFGCFLAGLVGAAEPLLPPRRGGGWPRSGLVAGPARRAAWRVVDAQYCELAQQRERVLVVGCPVDGSDPAAILFEPEGVQRHTPPRREAPEDVAGALAASFGSGGYKPELAARGHYIAWGIDADCIDRSGEAASGTAGDRSGLGIQTELAQAVRAKRPGAVAVAFGGNNQSGPIEVATARNACHTATGRLDFESETFIVHGTQDPLVRTDVALPLGRNSGQENVVCVTGEITHALKAEGADASEDGTGRGVPIIAFSCKDHGADAGHISPTLRAMNFANSHANAGGQVAVQIGSSVRRLMPVECERLQGFPDGYTDIPWKSYQRIVREARKAGASVDEEMRRAAPLPPDNDECPDGPRYMALGNSMAVPKMRWLLARAEAELRRFRRDGHRLIDVWRWATPPAPAGRPLNQHELFGAEGATS